MRIGIDARLYGVESGTGIGRYSQELLRQFLEIPNSKFQIPNLDVVVFLRRDAYEMFTLPNVHWTKVLADFRPYTIGVQTRYPRIIRDAGVDLMHFTHFDHPIRCPVPFIVTIHDLILLHYPSIRATTLGPIRFWIKYAAYRAVLRHAVTRSAHILTPSETIRQQLHHELCVPLNRITTTHLGVDHIETPETLLRQGSAGQADGWKLEAQTTRAVDCRLSTVDSPYLLSIGNAYPHKNIEQLVRIAPELAKIHPDFHVRIVGRPDDFSHRLRSTVRSRTPIVFMGMVSEPALAPLIRNASAYVSMSRDEGFDLPTLEACALGTAVIASDIPIHREILGDAALFSPPDDDTALLHAIHRLHADSALRGILSTRGIARAQSFTWERCASRTLDAYRATCR
ncbi:glycosyltransferase family 4 protein [Candidatus Uhrbacteria bacterium]|nr:glycosyltransferase family 4 protein [Candidatus Uhrbacteria bacterium]